MRILLLLGALLTGACAIPAKTGLSHKDDWKVPRPADTRIVGGNVVDISLVPYQVSLRYKSIFTSKSAYEHRCGGSIYSSRVIITVAHCIIAMVPSQFKVVAGVNERSGMKGVIVPVQGIVMHEQFNNATYNYDIAIVFLAEPLPLNNYTMKAIELADREVPDGAMSIVSGWGSTSQGGNSSSLLQAVHIPIVSNALCNEDHKGKITESMLCAGVRGVGGKGTCQGDSGGPLLVNGKLTGLVSWRNGCAEPNFPGVYANVSYLRPWLMEKIREFDSYLIEK